MLVSEVVWGLQIIQSSWMTMTYHMKLLKQRDTAVVKNMGLES